MVISRLFRNIVAAFPLIGAHREKEVELLLAGVKPIGTFNYSTSSECSERKAFREYVMQQVAPLEQACRDGRLKSTAVSRRDSIVGSDVVFLFYCQPGQDEDMAKLARYYQSPGPETALSDEEIGIYLGYTRGDVWLFKRGGYERLPIGLSWLAKTTHDYRTQCRIEAELQNSESMGVNWSAPNPATPS